MATIKFHPAYNIVWLPLVFENAVHIFKRYVYFVQCRVDAATIYSDTGTLFGTLFFGEGSFRVAQVQLRVVLIPEQTVLL